MLDDLDKTLEALVKRELPPNLRQQATISFATPDEEFPPEKVRLPAIDFFLYDVRENRDLRTNEWVVPTKQERQELAKKTPPVVRLHRPPVRLECSYLITAWASPSAPDPPHDEHQILSEVTKILLRHPTIPANDLQGTLAGQEPPLPTTSLQAGHLQNVSDFWQVLGKPKAALHFTVTISVDPFKPIDERLVTEADLRYALGASRDDAVPTNEVGHIAESPDQVAKDEIVIEDKVVEKKFTLDDVRLSKPNE